LLNRGPIVNGSSQPITAHWATLGLPLDAKMAVRDVMARKDVGVRQGSVTAQVAPHDVAFFRLSPVAPSSTRRKSDDGTGSPCGPDTDAGCTGGDLCRPLSPQPVFSHEVVAYHVDGAYGSNGSEYALYDYSKVTAIADYSWEYANETVCTAHLHGVRVLGFNMYDQGALNELAFYTNGTWMDAWIATAAKFTFDRGMDGMSEYNNARSFAAAACPDRALLCTVLDIEGAPHTVTPADFARFGCKLRAALHLLIPGAILTWSVSLYANIEAEQAAAVVTSSCAADFLTLMSYEAELSELGRAAGDKFTANVTAQATVPLCVQKPWKCSPMFAQAQSSPAALIEGVRQWNARGVNSSMLVLATGWFAKDFACNATADPTHPELCAIDFSSGWTSNEGGEPGYGMAVQLLRQGLVGQNGGVRQWDADLQTPFFDVAGDKVATVFDLPGKPLDPKAPWLGCNRCNYVVDGENKTRRHRIYYDDPASLSIKYTYAVANGLRGVGMWSADAAILAMGPELAQEMWAVVPFERPCQNPPCRSGAVDPSATQAKTDDEQESGRRSLVWYKPAANNFEPSLRTLADNRASVTDVVLYCGFGINPNGMFVHNISHGSGPQAYELCPKAVERIASLGMRAILISKTEHQKFSTVEAVLTNPKSCIDGMVKKCTAMPGVSGWNIDWEMGGSPAAQAQMAKFLQRARAALHAVNCTLTMDVGDSTRSLDADLTTYIDATDGLWDMSTYHGASLTAWKARFAKVQNSSTAKKKVGIGFADYDQTGWDSTEESVNERLKIIEASGYTRIAVFHLNSSDAFKLPQPFFWAHMATFLNGSPLKTDDDAELPWANIFNSSQHATLHFHPPSLVSKHLYWADDFWAFDDKHIFGRAAVEPVNRSEPNDFVVSSDGGKTWTYGPAIPGGVTPAALLPMSSKTNNRTNERSFFYFGFPGNGDPLFSLGGVITPDNTTGDGTAARPWRAASSNAVGHVTLGSDGSPDFCCMDHGRHDDCCVTTAKKVTFNFSTLASGFCSHTKMRQAPVDEGGMGVAALSPEDGGEFNWVIAPIMFLCHGSNTSKQATSVVAMRSKDGKHWDSTVVVADAKDFHTTEGANENALVRLASGELMCVIRFGAGYVPWSYYYQSFSTDQGASFSFPTAIDGAGSARPKLLLLNSGPLLMAGGRMGNSALGGGGDREGGSTDQLLWVSADGLGRKWKRFSISGWHNLMEPDKTLHFPAAINTTTWLGTVTNTYSSLIATGDSKFLYIYQLRTNLTGSWPAPGAAY
jgi:hypothetical protein